MCTWADLKNLKLSSPFSLTEIRVGKAFKSMDLNSFLCFVFLPSVTISIIVVQNIQLNHDIFETDSSIIVAVVLNRNTSITHLLP